MLNWQNTKGQILAYGEDGLGSLAPGQSTKVRIHISNVNSSNHSTVLNVTPVCYHKENMQDIPVLAATVISLNLQERSSMTNNLTFEINVLNVSQFNANSIFVMWTLIGGPINLIQSPDA